MLHYIEFIFPYRNGIVIDAKDALGFAWRRAEPAGYLRQIIGRHTEGLRPLSIGFRIPNHSIPGYSSSTGHPQWQKGVPNPCTARPAPPIPPSSRPGLLLYNHVRVLKQACIRLFFSPISKNRLDHPSESSSMSSFCEAFPASRSFLYSSGRTFTNERPSRPISSRIFFA